MSLTIKKLLTRYRKNEDGVAIIEGVLILPIAVLMFLGIFEAGQMLLLNQKVYAASHMVGDLLTRKGVLNNNDLDDAYAAGKMIIEPFDPTGLKLDIVGVQFDASQNAVKLWQETYNTTADASLHIVADGLGQENEGAIVVSAKYTYTPTFLNVKLPWSGSPIIFNIFEMEEVSVLRGRINSCISYDDGGTIYGC